MAHQRDTFELSIQIATAVERAAVERTDDAVIVNQTHHRDRVNRTLRQKVENFCGVAILQPEDANRIEFDRLAFVYLGGCARMQHWSTVLIWVCLRSVTA
jgi:hypothetical protein